MSTKIATIEGVRESSIPFQDRPGYITQEMILTRFFAGTARGMCLQITIGEEYIQLDLEGIEQLKQALNRI